MVQRGTCGEKLRGDTEITRIRRKTTEPFFMGDARDCCILPAIPAHALDVFSASG